MGGKNLNPLTNTDSSCLKHYVDLVPPTVTSYTTDFSECAALFSPHILCEHARYNLMGLVKMDLLLYLMGPAEKLNKK